MLGVDDEREGAELRKEQRERRDQEEELADASLSADEAAAHTRRAEKADYLQRRLAERERSDQ